MKVDRRKEDVRRSYLELLVTLSLVILLLLTTLMASIPEAIMSNSTQPAGVFAQHETVRKDSGVHNLEDSALSVLALNDGEWVPFIPDALPGTRSRILPKSRDTMGLCVDSTFFGMYNRTTVIESIRYNIIEIPSAGHAEEVGKPAMPLVTRYLEIPYGVNITLTILYEESRILDDYYVIPAQEAMEDNPYSPIPPFTLDSATYIADAFFPSEIAVLEGGIPDDPMILRGRRIVALTFYPAQFNPVQGQLKAFSKIEVRLNYNHPAQVDAIPTRLVSAAFEELCQGLILNYHYRPSTKLAQTVLTSASNHYGLTSASSQSFGPAEYLIIVNDIFYDQILPLAEWKAQKGLLTEVVKTSQITSTGPTATPSADDIAGFIQDAYNTWATAPSYVLLVGDSDHIYPHYVINHYSDVHSGHPVPTDLYYGTVDGTDMFPDLFVGRLSVDTTDHVTTIVQKILDYEKTPPDPALYPEFYSNIAACAYFQDNLNDGTADRRYVETSEDIIRQNTYFGLDAIGYTVDRIYETNGANPRWWDSGGNIPNDLLMANGFPWDGDRAKITSNITEGRFLIYHRNHGGSQNCWYHDRSVWGDIDGWNHPEYLVGDIGGLANGGLLPFVLSIECQNGWYDGEVDNETWGGQDAMLDRNVESFCEEFVRHAGGGAIAAIGASRNSPSYRNDKFLKGLIDAIWPEFDSDFNSGGLYSFGQVLVYGKVYMANLYHPTTIRTEVMFSLYNLFGDPKTPLWTSAPGDLTATYPSSIGSLGLQSFVVTVNDDASGDPIGHAKVCLRRGSDVFEVAYTDPLGHAYFDITPSSTGSISITITRHNYYPHEGVIAVTGNGATLSLDIDVGPGGMTVTLDGDNYLAGESVSINFGGTVMLTTPLGASFSQEFTVPVDGAGPLNIIGTGTSGRVGVTVFRRIPEGVNLYIYSQWDDSTWNRNPDGAGSDVNPVWNNPCIQLYNKATGVAVASNNLIVGTTYTIEATIYNRALTIATDAIVSFEWAYIGAGQSWNEIDTVTVTVPAAGGIINWVEGQATAEVDWTPSVTGHTCIVARISHPWDLNLDDNRGQENTHVLPISSPGLMNFTVFNPSDTTALVYLEVRQKGRTDDIWATTLDRDYPQELAPGENQTVRLLVEAPDSAPDNETRIFVVHAYIDGELIGGVEINVVKNPPPPPLPIPIELFWFGVAIVLLVVIIVVVRFRKR